MGLNAGNLPVTGVYVGSTPIKAVYVGSKVVWREKVQITLSSQATYQAQQRFRAALTERGLDHTTITEVPFDIELVGSGSTNSMFRHCAKLKSAPVMDTSRVDNMGNMFRDCTALTYVPDMVTSNVTRASSMFTYCPSLTDGNVRLLGKHPNVTTTGMLTGSGLTRMPFYDTNGNPI